MERLCVGALLGAMMGGSLSQILAVEESKSPLDGYGVPCPEVNRDRNMLALFESLHAQGLLRDARAAARLLDACNMLLHVSRLSREKPTDAGGNPTLHVYQIKAEACLRESKRRIQGLRAALPDADRTRFDESAREIAQVCDDKVHNIILQPLDYR